MNERVRPYRCPGCDREANVYFQRSTAHNFGDNGLVITITCGREDGITHRGRGSVNECLGEWFRVRPFTSEISAVSAWNDAVIEMGAAAVGITPQEARGLKEGRLVLAARASGKEGE